jgi:hypothetical protein
MSDIAYLPPPGPVPVEGCVAPDHNREPPEEYDTPLVDNNAVSGVVIDQNACKVENRGPDVVGPPADARREREEELKAEPYDGDPLENPDVIGHPGSLYEDPYLDFFDPPTMKAPDVPPEEMPTRPPDWVAEGEGAGEVPPPETP